MSEQLEARLVGTEQELNEAGRVLLQLRTGFELEELLQQVREQQQEGYQLAIAVLDEQVIGVAGFAINRKLAWGKHIYVDDLVTHADHRSTGAGKALMNWLRAYGREQGCEQLHLDSGVQRFGAHRFYLREGFDINSHHFAIGDLSL
ncbi:aminoalkylphosphonic acid N-acetyltransferase [Microbulbifer aggregans]|uniref:Aminoalkylphosphonic acid N-acetyltransferase n=1 Tax=Microbulbifer aggregans TaxID=1769779 RepID=A0A1C9W4D9_9GAMM|nr:GNAT family N-acetyltransferase [Microbulbifer aggregans]AOS96005.1 aminoalkylphosphonic acid N-acetyltransferase [Microbulbifer aggregans]